MAEDEKMKDGRMTILWVVAVVAAMTVEAQADFVLINDDHLTVHTPHTFGESYDNSIARVVQGGRVDYLSVYDTSTGNISGGSVGRLLAYDTSTVNISSGSILYYGSHSVYDNSTVNISGGSVSTLHAYDTSTVNISGGEAFGGTSAWGSNTINISGGEVSSLRVYGNTTGNISGGVTGELMSHGFSTIALIGYDFGLSGDLSWAPDGETILGTGLLTGKWFDDTSFMIPITSHDNTATIMAIPEPATLLLFGLGGLALRRKMRR
jgi:hypothetical protein